MSLRNRIRHLRRAIAPHRRPRTRPPAGGRTARTRGVGIRARLGRFRIGAGAGRR